MKTLKRVIKKSKSTIIKEEVKKVVRVSFLKKTVIAK